MERLDALLFDACARFGGVAALEDAQRRLSYAELAGPRARLPTACAGRACARRAGAGADFKCSADIAAFLASGRLAAWLYHLVPPPTAVTEATRAATHARLMVQRAKHNASAIVRRRRAAAAERRCPHHLHFGSTGAPKGVVIGHKAFAQSCWRSTAISISRRRRARCWCCRSPSSSHLVHPADVAQGGSVFMCRVSTPWR